MMARSAGDGPAALNRHQKPGDTMDTALRLALAGAAAALSPLAFAHAQLVASSPAKGQVLDAPPIEIRLTFSEHVEPRTARLKLVSADKKYFDADRAHADKADPNSVAMSVPVLHSGSYRAVWSAVGGDGQKAHGDFTFTIK
jgi:methionine-rich copper-binding protein CopC